MKQLPRIQIYWENPPSRNSGVTVRRVSLGGVYERQVPSSGLLSSAEAAAAIGITLRHLYNLINDGTLKATRKAGRVFLKLSDIKKYLNTKRSRSDKTEPWLIG